MSMEQLNADIVPLIESVPSFQTQCRAVGCIFVKRVRQVAI